MASKLGGSRIGSYTPVKHASADPAIGSPSDMIWGIKIIHICE